MNSMNETRHFGSDFIERIVCKSLTKKLRKQSPSKMAARWCLKKAKVWLAVLLFCPWMPGCIINRDGLRGAEIQRTGVHWRYLGGGWRA